MSEDDRQTLTVPEAGKALGLTRHGAYLAAQRGEIPTLRFGRLLRVSKAWLRSKLEPIPQEGITKERSDGKRSNGDD
jgi:excisionase family DNA binding protein